MRKLLSTTVAGGAAALALVALAAGPASAGTADSQFDVTFPAASRRPSTTCRTPRPWPPATTCIEERLTQTSEDHIVTSKTCDLTKLVNDNYTWFLSESVNTCVAPSTTYDGEVWWSTDSTIAYDILGDGQGAITQELLGSPLVHG